MRRAVVVTLLALSWTGACTRVGLGPKPPSPQSAGTEGARAQAAEPPLVFGGTVTLGKQRLPVVLELSGNAAGERTATLRIPAVPMEATGSARWSGDRLRLDLTYGDACPGTVAVDAWVAEGRAVGTLEARDCTGSDSGPLVLERRGASEHGPAAPR